MEDLRQFLLRASWTPLFKILSIDLTHFLQFYTKQPNHKEHRRNGIQLLLYRGHLQNYIWKIFYPNDFFAWPLVQNRLNHSLKTQSVIRKEHRSLSLHSCITPCIPAVYLTSCSSFSQTDSLVIHKYIYIYIYIYILLIKSDSDVCGKLKKVSKPQSVKTVEYRGCIYTSACENIPGYLHQWTHRPNHFYS